ncbi:unnamed protein product, partial [Musa hybrid cultivar]
RITLTQSRSQHREEPITLRIHDSPRPLPPFQPPSPRSRLRWGRRLCVHGVRPDGVGDQGRDGRHRGADGGGRGGGRGRGAGPGGVGRPHGPQQRLLRAGGPRRLQRPRALRPLLAALPPQPHLRRRRAPPRLVLRLRRGHRHGVPHPLLPDPILCPPVARHRRPALPPLRHRRRLRPVQSHRRADPPPTCGRRWLPRALIILLVSECPLWRMKMLCLSCGVGVRTAISIEDLSVAHRSILRSVFFHLILIPKEKVTGKKK